MPSGAKKRKAAKKKKGTQPNSNNPNSSPAHSQRGGDVHSDVGEASSTASQDHPSHHDLLTEGEEEKIENRENVSNPPPVEGVQIEGEDEHGIVEERIAVPVEREFKVEDEFNRKNGRFEHDETERKSYDGGSSGSSSSSSSSDDESHDVKNIKNSQAVVDTAPVSVKVDHSLHGENIEAVSTTTIGEASDAVVDSVPPVASDKVSLLNESVEVDTVSPANSSAAPYVAESVYKENGEKKGSVEEEVGVLESFKDAASQLEEGGVTESFKDAASQLEEVGISESFKDAVSQLEEATIPSVKNNAATSNPKTCLAEETDDRLSLSYNAPTPTYDNGADAEKDSGVTEPLLVPPPHPVQTTSWKGCCGLFELFAGSDR
ncbi:hypothetical protein C2S53_001633 [Perilla frutescens var. hirtella]|uniref:Uncharacterized protein n=1 Tax=Perilla frutescens var. hirtella TaxID=608512 RepID=A0AAD4P4S0_PERFH|nr:hypothetical protein C2S53_001633 [Perilla frutescens var. hirtella]